MSEATQSHTDARILVVPHWGKEWEDDGLCTKSTRVSIAATVSSVGNIIVHRYEIGNVIQYTVRFRTQATTTPAR
jgi:hypothetical protein